MPPELQAALILFGLSNGSKPQVIIYSTGMTACQECQALWEQ